MFEKKWKPKITGDSFKDTFCCEELITDFALVVSTEVTFLYSSV